MIRPIQNAQIEKTRSVSIWPSEIVLLSSNTTATAGKPRPINCQRRPIARMRVRLGYTGLPGCADCRGPGSEVGHIGPAAGPQHAEIDLRQAAQPHQASCGADAAGERGDRGDQVIVDSCNLVEFQENAMGVVFLERLPDPIGQGRLRSPGSTVIAVEAHKQPVWPPLDVQLPAAGPCLRGMWIGNRDC